MLSASAVRLQIESALAQRIPSALTPLAKMLRPVWGTGIEVLDDVLRGGLPIGAVTELTGPECSGRTSVAASFLARITQASKVCAWIDVNNAFDPVSAAATGLDLQRLLWVRCGASQMPPSCSGQKFALQEKYLLPRTTKKGLHGGGFGPHPRSEVKGLPEAVSVLLRPEPALQHATPQLTAPEPRLQLPRQQSVAATVSGDVAAKPWSKAWSKPWSRMEQALRSADLLLQGGGFAAIVLDMASLAPEVVCRVPLATWHRYRLAAQRTQSSILLLTQHPCAKSSAELLLCLQAAEAICDESTVFTGIKPHVEVARQRFSQDAGKVIPLRKQPQGATVASWQCRTAWAGGR